MNQQYILFENFLTENYYVNSLTEEEIAWIYENEFLPKLNDKEYLNEKLRLLDILGGAAAGALTGALTGFGAVPGGIAGAIGGLTATYPEGKELDKLRQKKAKDKKRKMAEEICSSTTHSIRKTKMKLTEDYIEETFADFLEQNYHTEKLTEGNVVWIFEHEYVPALFEFYLEETYEISSLNEENTSNIYENKFIPALMKAYSLDESYHKGMKKKHKEDEEKEDDEKEEMKEKKHKEEKKEMKESSAMDIYTSFLELQEKKSGSLRSHKKMKDKVGKKDDVNNDGKVNDEDDYLENRRNAISKAIASKKK